MWGMTIFTLFLAVLVTNFEFAGFPPKQKYTDWTVSWKRSVLQNPDRERTNQSTGIWLRLGLPYKKIYYFHGKHDDMSVSWTLSSSPSHWYRIYRVACRTWLLPNFISFVRKFCWLLSMADKVALPKFISVIFNSKFSQERMCMNPPWGYILWTHCHLLRRSLHLLKT